MRSTHGGAACWFPSPISPTPTSDERSCLLCEHNDEGSFGFVLNRFIDMDINDLMENMPQIKTRISIGGPVQSGNLYYLHTLGRHIEGSLEVVDGVHMGGDFEQMRAILATDPKLAPPCALLRRLFRLGPAAAGQGAETALVAGLARRQAPRHEHPRQGHLGRHPSGHGPAVRSARELPGRSVAQLSAFSASRSTSVVDMRWVYRLVR